jgi:hypothetical protein
MVAYASVWSNSTREIAKSSTYHLGEAYGQERQGELQLNNY